MTTINPPTSQTDRQTDRRHATAIAITARCGRYLSRVKNCTSIGRIGVDDKGHGTDAQPCHTRLLHWPRYCLGLHLLTRRFCSHLLVYYTLKVNAHDVLWRHLWRQLRMVTLHILCLFWCCWQENAVVNFVCNFVVGTHFVTPCHFYSKKFFSCHSRLPVNARQHNVT